MAETGERLERYYSHLGTASMGKNAEGKGVCFWNQGSDLNQFMWLIFEIYVLYLLKNVIEVYLTYVYETITAKAAYLLPTNFY